MGLFEITGLRQAHKHSCIKRCVNEIQLHLCKMVIETFDECLCTRKAVEAISSMCYAINNLILCTLFCFLFNTNLASILGHPLQLEFMFHPNVLNNMRRISDNSIGTVNAKLSYFTKGFAYIKPFKF